MPRRYRRVAPKPTGPRTNYQIRVPRVVLIDDTGQRVGTFLTDDAVSYAKERELDLIEVAPNASPPVCRLGDVGKIKYELQKRKRRERKNSRRGTLKELKVRPKTDDHDMAVKTRRTRSFLQEGNKVKITVWFRGREHAHHNIGADQCLRIADAVEDIGRIEQPPRMDGRRMHMVLAPDEA